MSVHAEGHGDSGSAALRTDALLTTGRIAAAAGE
jgi:hypothetical protein